MQFTTHMIRLGIQNSQTSLEWCMYQVKDGEPTPSWLDFHIHYHMARIVKLEKMIKGMSSFRHKFKYL